MNTASSAILLHGVGKSYGTTTALDALDLEIRPGEFVALLGPSGAGKSTLFRCLTALERPDTGTIQMLGHALDQLDDAALRLVRRDIGLIFQQFNLIGRMSAMENCLAGRLGHVSTWRAVLRRFPDTDRQLALQALDRVGLLERAYQRADRLSGGQQQRVAIARVLTQQSRLILADEPVSSLDPESAANVLGLLRTIARESGIAVLCSLHQVDLALTFSDRIIGLQNGRLVIDAPSAALDAQRIAALYRPPVPAAAPAPNPAINPMIPATT